MSWNFRYCKKTNEYAPGEVEVTYEIHEVYYNSDGDVCGITEQPCTMYGESKEELVSLIARFNEALDKEPLDIDTLKYADWDE